MSEVNSEVEHKEATGGQRDNEPLRREIIEDMVGNLMNTLSQTTETCTAGEMLSAVLTLSNRLIKAVLTNSRRDREFNEQIIRSSLYRILLEMTDESGDNTRHH
jgi:hypothetical protein